MLANKYSQESYLENQVLTASPEELILLLYDGAIRFCHQGQAALEKQDWGTAGKHLVRAQRIIQQLQVCLNAEASPELVKNLDALYAFINSRLSSALIRRKTEGVEEAVRIIRTLQEAWSRGVVKPTPAA